MKTFYWLVKREFWENRGGFLWAPVVTGVVFLVLNIMAIIAAEVVGARHGFNIGGNNLQELIAKADAGDMQQIGAGLDIVMISAMGLISFVTGIVVLVYCLGRSTTTAATAACCSGNRYPFPTPVRSCQK